MKKINKKSMTKLAFDIMKYLHDNGLWDSLIIYASGKRYMTPDYGISPKRTRKTYEGITYIEENTNVKDYIRYSNPETISISFEGMLYDIIYDNLDYITKLDNLFLNQYGLHFELGEAWNMSAYEN